MKKVDFNKDWKFVKGCIPSLKVLQMYGKEAEEICLPHDAMIHEVRDENTKNGERQDFIPVGHTLILRHFLCRQSGKISL